MRSRLICRSFPHRTPNRATAQPPFGKSGGDYNRHWRTDAIWWLWQAEAEIGLLRCWASRSTWQKWNLRCSRSALFSSSATGLTSRLRVPAQPGVCVNVSFVVINTCGRWVFAQNVLVCQRLGDRQRVPEVRFCSLGGFRVTRETPRLGRFGFAGQVLGDRTHVPTIGV